jgi:hypothetical protein
MAVRKTSIEAYKEIESNGLLEGLLWITYRALYQFGPMTQNETCRKINNGDIQDRSIMPRFAQLKKYGVIEEIGTKKCDVTGREVLLWDVTANLPRKIEKKASRRVWYGLYSRIEGETHKLFRIKSDAIAYKTKFKISGEIHEFEQIGR